MTSAADEIKAWRHRLNWTQEQAAEALDVPVQTVRAWEIGRYLPRHRRVLTLALAQITSEQRKQKARPMIKRRFRAQQ
jgi:DNA-binding transcriptional regulator YiaG